MYSAAVTDVNKLKNIASQVRRDIVRMVHAVQSGHPGGSLGCADYFTALYFHIMNHNPNHFTIEGHGEDIFILSNGHISPALYSVLARNGYFPIEELATFRKLNSRLQGHPTTMEHLPGIRVATGSLGQGLSFATGVALQKKLDADPSIVYVNLGDGELQEGQNWEAIMYAAHNQVDNLIATIDFNKQQIDGSTVDIMGFDNLRNKFESFGWLVMEMNGNNMEQILQKMKEAKEKTGMDKPIAVIMKTEMGAGVDFMMGSHKWHGIPPNDQQLADALAQLPETLGDY
ncbi:MAG: transketolase [Bacteroidia bacterium]|nr:transketolase [Bacteroidia bacterium]